MRQAKISFIVIFLGVLFVTATAAGAQDLSIYEIPPAMNLLSEIPSQAGSAVQQSGQQNQNQDQPSHSQAGTNPLPETETFTGAVRKGSDGCFLQSANGLSYRLDDARKAMPFEGKQVQITGRLEMDTNLIHIEAIRPAQ